MDEGDEVDEPTMAAAMSDYAQAVQNAAAAQASSSLAWEEGPKAQRYAAELHSAAMIEVAAKWTSTVIMLGLFAFIFGLVAILH